MKANYIKILWGIALIALGGVFLADTLGYIDLELFSHQGWAIVLAVSSIAFFLTYFLSGVRNWGLLFPALICAALAVIVGLALENQYEDTLIPVLILLSVGIPFYVGYLIDRKQWGLLIPAWILTAIPAIVFLSESSLPDLAGAFSLFAIALPFLVVYLANRLRKWALIVSAVLAYIGLFPLLGSNLSNEFSGPVVMGLLALPFIVIYLAAKKAWWALIPVGVFFSIGVVALLDTLWPDVSYFMIGGLEFGGYSGVLLLGFAITFGLLWLRRATQPTAWAKYPAIGLLIVSILAFLKWQTTSNWIPAIVLLVSGVALILASLLKRHETQPFTSQNP